MNIASTSRRRVAHGLAIAVALFALVGTALAATGGAGAGRFAATFEARAVGDPSVEACRGLGASWQKIEAHYTGTFTVPAEFMPAEFLTTRVVPAEFNLPLQLSLEIVVDRATGVGTAEGTWRLGDPPTEADPPTEFAARGELLAVVTTAESPELELHGMLIGLTEPPDPDMPAQRLLLNFTAGLSDGATFPHLKGTVGDPTVGDPTVGDPSAPGALVPAIKC